jgi:hypothetical protein
MTDVKDRTTIAADILANPLPEEELGDTNRYMLYREVNNKPYWYCCDGKWRGVDTVLALQKLDPIPLHRLFKSFKARSHAEDALKALGLTDAKVIVRPTAMIDATPENYEALRKAK